MKFPVANMNVGTLAAGAGVVLLAPVVIPLVAGILRPVAKNVIKGSLLVYDKTKTTVAEAKESIEDVAAEAKAELQELSAEAKAEISGSKAAKKKPATA
jgi:F0F1-type ATP synthase membrane subunit b/b'